MKKPLPVCVRFHRLPDGSRLQLLTCAETGRPLDYQLGLSTKYMGGQDSIEVKSKLLVPVEQDEPLADAEGDSTVEDYYDDDDDAEEAYDDIIGFRN